MRANTPRVWLVAVVSLVAGTALAQDVRPFEVAVPDEVLADLQERLERTRFPDQLDGVGWDYGTELDYLKELVAYWQTDFDWRAQERRVNAFDHFLTTIDNIELHFIHQRSRHEDALPLLILHGWPGSVFEFHKVIAPLTTPEDHAGGAADAFHVVAPSLPGYGFSGKPREAGFGPEHMAEMAVKLMRRLGYDRFAVQGGDWGSIIARRIAHHYPDVVVGLHLNFVLGASPPDPDDPDEGVPEVELARMKERQRFLQTELGYANIQSTRPQTLGYGLTDSPAGLAAWIVEKFRAWSDCNGDVESVFTKDELLTNVMIYWATGTITSSARLYFEARIAGDTSSLPFVDVPTGVAVFPKELILPPRRWVENNYRVTHWSVMPRGGHFAALEQPELLVTDMRAFFTTLR